MKNEDLKFLFVTANTNESNALIESKMIDWESDRIISDRQKSDISLYRVGKIKSTGHFVIHFQLLEQGSSGVNASLTSVDSAIKQWSPDAVICLGIAFGKGGEDQKIGDVLVSDSIINFARTKISKGHYIPKAEQPASGSILRRIAAEFANDWESQNKVFRGPMLCSDHVIDCHKSKKKLFQAFPNAIGGEMEANGVYAACRRNNIEEWIIIKAICDWGENKQEHKEANK